jgi:pantothenate kinase
MITLNELIDVIRKRGVDGRTITAIVGPPGSGKSTLAERVVRGLNDIVPRSAAILAMDGYHLDDGLLGRLGLRSRKGSPETFDVGGLLEMIRRLKRDQDKDIVAPVFDREFEIARAGARIIPPSVRHVIAEGNYLLLKRPCWSDLTGLFDVAVMVTVPEQVLGERWRTDGAVTTLRRSRLLQRWKKTIFRMGGSSSRRASSPNLSSILNSDRNAPPPAAE